MKWSIISPLRMVLLDDHALIRDALKIRLSLETDFKVLGVYSTSRDLLVGLRAQQIDLLILDYQLASNELDGLRLIQLLRSHYPLLKIVIFSTHERPAIVSMSLRAGANGFVSKSQETDELLYAIRTIATDRTYLSPAMTSKLENLPVSRPADTEQFFSDDSVLANHAKLSPRESEVLRCYLGGMSISQIANKFLLSPKTISSQKLTAFRKLGIQTDSELFQLYFHLKES